MLRRLCPQATRRFHASLSLCLCSISIAAGPLDREAGPSPAKRPPTPHARTPKEACGGLRLCSRPRPDFRWRPSHSHDTRGVRRREGGDTSCRCVWAISRGTDPEKALPRHCRRGEQTGRRSGNQHAVAGLCEATEAIDQGARSSNECRSPPSAATHSNGMRSSWSASPLLSNSPLDCTLGRGAATDRPSTSARFGFGDLRIRSL